MKRLAWSYSALSTFETCPKKFYHLRVAKDYKDADSDAARDGKFVHDAMFQRVINGKALPIQLRQHEKIANFFAEMKGEKHGEMRLALNAKFEPRDFFAKDVWVRAVVDLLVVDGTRAYIVDWKTGKQKDDFTQLQLTAASLSRYMPEVEEFVLVFAWLKDSNISKRTILKAEMRRIWTEFLPRVAKMDKANKTTEFPAIASGLCGWCPCTGCPNWFDKDAG